jgi:hypothetical protein
MLSARNGGRELWVDEHEMVWPKASVLERVTERSGYAILEVRDDPPDAHEICGGAGVRRVALAVYRVAGYRGGVGLEASAVALLDKAVMPEHVEKVAILRGCALSRSSPCCASNA